MKELMPFKFNPLPRGVVAHNFDLFHRDFLERLRVRYETSPPSVMEWFETPYLHGLLQLFSIEQRQQVMWGRKITIKSLGGFDEVLDFLAVPMKGETFVLYKEYVQELDKDMYIKKYLKSSYPIFFGDEITSRYHFDNHKLCISQRSKKNYQQYDLKKRVWIICGQRNTGMSHGMYSPQKQIEIPYMIMLAVEDMEKTMPSDLIHIILSYAFGRSRDIEKYTFVK